MLTIVNEELEIKDFFCTVKTKPLISNSSFTIGIKDPGASKTLRDLFYDVYSTLLKPSLLHGDASTITHRQENFQIVNKC